MYENDEDQEYIKGEVVLNSRHMWNLSATVSICALAIMSGPVSAQSEPEEEADTTASVGDVEIVVTGTQLRSGATTPTPVTVTSGDTLRTKSPGLLADALNQLPAFKGSSRSSNSTQSGARDNGAAFLNLRGLGKEKTLVLLDGRRIVSSSNSGVTDVNLIPQNLVRSVEVVTGGASSAYGSDAVAGVVNFILDKRYSGLQLGGSAGISTYSDGGSQNVYLKAGTPFASERGHVIANLEYFSQDAIGFGTGRDNVESNAGIATIAPGVRAVVRDQRFSVPYGGRINALSPGSPLPASAVNLQFLEGGAVAPFSFGTLSDGVRQVGGSGGPLPFNLTAATERYNGFLRAEYDVSDDFNVYTELLAAQSTTIGAFQYPQVGILGYQYTIYSDNAFLRALPAQTQATLGLPAAGGPSIPLFGLRRIPQDNGLSESRTRSRTWRAVAGFDWDFGSDYQLSAYYAHGENKYRNELYGNPIQLRRYAAVDAVVDPGSGDIVCRVTLTNPTLFPGCVPYNPFGPNPGNSASNDYINGESDGNISISRLTTRQQVASVTLRGSPIELPAGKVDFAIGGVYRKEVARQDDATNTQRILRATDPEVLAIRSFPSQLINVPGGYYQYGSPSAVNGEYDVREVFGEVNLPILSDKPFANLLSVSGAVRYIDYSTVGGVTAWKVGGIYEPVDWLRARFTRSRDIRAGNMVELFSSAINLQGTVNFNGTARPLTGSRLGNPVLKPEIANTLTAGIVLTPLHNLSLTVDYYDIKLTDAITLLSAQQTIDACATGSQLACSQINDIGTSVRVTTPYLNLAEVNTRGVDLEGIYSVPLDSGNLNFRLLVSYLDKYDTIVPGATTQRRAGDLGLTGTPKWSGSLSVSYDSDRFGVFIQERFIGSGKVDSMFTDSELIGNSVGEVFYTDVTLRAKVGGDESAEGIELFATANNLFNRQPPIVPAVPFGNYRPTNAALYDVIGRYFTFGARVSF